MNTAIKNTLPIILTAIALLVFAVIIAKHERHLATGDDLFVKLAPADPRSLIQGDYMALSYQFDWQNPTQTDLINTDLVNADLSIDEMPSTVHKANYHNQSHIGVWVLTDNKQKVIKSAFAKDEFSPQEQPSLRPLIVNNPSNRLANLYPAANSFLFAEGLADCYNQATFAHLKTDRQDSPILVDLVNDDLQPLNCESRIK